MKITDILKELEYNKGYFPEKVLKEAIKRKEEIIPELLKVLENLNDNFEEMAKKNYYFIHIYAMYLLAQFREERAFPIIIEIIKGPHEEVDMFLGDILTEDMGNILASVFNGELNLLYDVIEDNSLCIYA